MKLLLDINVLLDVLLRREPWDESAAHLLTRIERGEASGFVAGHTLTTIHYIVSRARDRQSAAAAISDLLRFLDVVPVEKVDFSQALVLPIDDFEDAVQGAAALKIGADYVVTRDEAGFRALSIPSVNPGEILSLL
ncbi:MAG: PIN domain-containing protein [Gemmatimonadetes bacterium]|nr:PIN domain-containing protein [Gemmatimonadota bacterium]